MNPGTIPNKNIRKDNVYLGVDTYQTYGPTSVTNWRNGYTVPSGGYVTYLDKGTIGPSIYMCTSDSDLIDNVHQVFGYTAANVEDALGYYLNLTNNMCVNINYDDLNCINLELAIDFGFTPCYPRTGTVFNDLGRVQGNGTINNLTTFSSGGFNGGRGVVYFDQNIDGGVTLQALGPEYYDIRTLSIWYIPDSTQFFRYCFFDSVGGVSDLILNSNGPGLGFTSLGAEIAIDGDNFQTLNHPSQYMFNDSQVHNIIIRLTGGLAGDITDLYFLNNGGNNRGMIGSILAAFAWSDELSQDEVSRHYDTFKVRLT